MTHSFWFKYLCYILLYYNITMNYLLFLVLWFYGLVSLVIINFQWKYWMNISYISTTLLFLLLGFFLWGKKYKFILYTYILFSLYVTLPFSFLKDMWNTTDQFSIFTIFIFFLPFIIYPLAILEYFLETRANREKV